MTEAKFWAFLGIAIGAVAFCPNNFGTWGKIVTGIMVLIICYFFSWFWNKITASHHKFIDAIFFLFSKTKMPYVVVDKIIRYSIKNSDSATYKVNCKLKCIKEIENFGYNARYHWDQEQDVHVSVSNKKNCTYTCSEDLKWSNIFIAPSDKIIHKKDNWECGFLLDNLHINKLSKHSYLSCKMIEKVEHLKLIAEVNCMLNPSEFATFVVQDTYGEELSKEKVPFNRTSSTYEKTVKCPRKGRKYILKWDYK